MTTVTRRYRFPASHRLHLWRLTEAENLALFGKCNNPFGHGHDYVLDVTVAGPVDKTTGLIVRTAELDRLVENRILRVFSHRNINIDVPQFAELIPTTENVALVIAQILERNWSLAFGKTSGAYLLKVQVYETDRNSFEVWLVTPEKKKSVRSSHKESVPVNA